MLNGLSIDVEDWFCVYNLSAVIKREDWDKCESRVVKNTERILNVLREYNTKATFFILGWIAERYPEIIHKIDEAGHEIATHGYAHHLLTSLTPEVFEEDLVRSLTVLRKHTQQEIIGFRAPSFTMTKETYWTLEILEKHGIKYDSSVFPIGFHPDYGVKESPLTPYHISSKIIEFPLGCAEVFGLRLPCHWPGEGGRRRG